MGKPPSIPPSMLPSMPPVIFPARGVKVLRGWDSGTSEIACVTDPNQTTVGSGNFATIATQCCEADGTCRRYVDTNDNDGCIAGHSRKVSPQGSIQAMAYAKARASCSALGLQLCTTSCAGKGCLYNR